MPLTLPHGPLDRPGFDAAARPHASERQQRRWRVCGTLQGVGFRPFVRHLASDLGLDGRVRHLGDTVLIDAEGDPDALDAFERRLRTQAPALATITGLVRVAARPGGLTGGGGFVIEESLPGTADGRTAAHRDIPPDTATCDACLAELFDPRSRHFSYPFISCADCGPRAGVIDGLPYTRQRTAMAAFPMCEACDAQYRDPADRRFHAESTACAQCGPQLGWQAGTARAERHEALDAAVACLAGGGIVAVKGLGGFQLMCDATDRHAVALLRRRTVRPAEPFAVMVADEHAAARLARLSVGELRLLTSPARPIVLTPTHAPDHRHAVDHAVTGDAPSVGLVLAATALHHLLLRALDRPLAFTGSGMDGGPGVTEDAEAAARLGALADGILGHDRAIRARYGDSVAAVIADRPVLRRRARGYSPAPLDLPIPAGPPLVALGARLEHTVTLAWSASAIIGPPVGDLHAEGAYDEFTAVLDRLARLHGVVPEYAAHDLDPGLLSTRYADRFPAARRIPVQHHHAHIASCAAEHALVGDVIGVAYDGPALGDDGTFWGGEIMVANLTGYTRLARFALAPRPDGTADSSADRLFDTAAAILGLCEGAAYEGRANAALEHAAAGVRAEALPWRLEHTDGLWVFDSRTTLAALADGIAAGIAVAHLAAAFHSAIAEVTCALVEKAARVVGDKPVCLSGSVWRNRLLTEQVVGALDGQNFEVFINQRVPCDDGGISYGQAAVAAAILADA